MEWFVNQTLEERQMLLVIIGGVMKELHLHQLVPIQLSILLAKVEHGP
jgi:hypothetical protein